MPENTHSLNNVVQMLKGRFAYLPAYIEPEAWLNADFSIQLSGPPYRVDHYLQVLPSKKEWELFTIALNRAGCPTVEGPALWPVEFCDETFADTPKDLWLNLATLDIQGRGLLVLVSPVETGDQIHRFFQKHGPTGVHHIAVLCEDVDEEAALFFADGWKRTSAQPARDDGLIQWFIKNSTGQILELISRPSQSHNTFTCNNIKSLRSSEGK